MPIRIPPEPITEMDCDRCGFEFHPDDLTDLQGLGLYFVCSDCLYSVQCEECRFMFPEDAEMLRWHVDECECPYEDEIDGGNFVRGMLNGLLITIALIGLMVLGAVFGGYDW